MKEHKRWEEIHNRQEPVTTEMILQQVKMSLKFNEDSFDAAMRDWLIIGHYTGFRLNEWAQELKILNKGRFAINVPAEGGDGKKGKRLPNIPNRVLQDRELAYLDIRWRFQNNGDN
eukprot:5534975-Ditylum_brightwellii.AAC.1